MAIITLNGNGQIKTGRTEIDVPHKDGIITFVYPLKGPNYHSNVMSEIDSDSLFRPTTAQTFSLVDLAIQNKNEAHCAEVLNRFKNNYLWTSTESLSVPAGVIVYDNVDGKMPANSKDLLEKLSAGDSSVRFVPKGFKTGAMPISEFLKHPYTIAQVGEDMLETIERVAKYYHKKEAYVFGLDNAVSDTKRFTALGSIWLGCGLDLDGSCRDDGRNGFAFGVSGKSAEGASQKNK